MSLFRTAYLPPLPFLPAFHCHRKPTIRHEDELPKMVQWGGKVLPENLSKGVNVGELHVYRSGNAAFKDGSFDLCFIRWRSLKILPCNSENNCLPPPAWLLRSTRLYSQEPKENVKRFDFRVYCPRRMRRPISKTLVIERRVVWDEHCISNIWIDQSCFFISLLPLTVVILPKLFFCIFLIENLPCGRVTTQKCRGRCVRIQNADDVDHFRSRFPAPAPSCRSILRGLRPPPTFENRFHPRCQCRPASVTRPGPGQDELAIDIWLALGVGDCRRPDCHRQLGCFGTASGSLPLLPQQ